MAPDMCIKCNQHRGEVKEIDCDHKPRICPSCKKQELGVPTDARYCQFCDNLMNKT